MNREPRPCELCEKKFVPKGRRETRFCSKTCSNRWTAKNRHTSKGRTVSSKGYVLIHRPDHPRAATYGYVPEHRLVMEQVIGRRLRRNEVVHHRDGNKKNNAPANLVVMTKRRHDRETNRNRRHVVRCPSCGHEFAGRKHVRYVRGR